MPAITAPASNTSGYAASITEVIAPPAESPVTKTLPTRYRVSDAERVASSSRFV